MANVKAIMALYESNDKFKTMVDTALAAEHERLLKAASLFEAAKEEPVIESVESPKRIPGSKNHKSAIMNLITTNGGSMSLKNIREGLLATQHDISPSTLNSVVCEMKRKGELIATGDHGHGVYSVITKE